jgi:hypothetical protein
MLKLMGAAMKDSSKHQSPFALTALLSKLNNVDVNNSTQNISDHLKSVSSDFDLSSFADSELIRQFGEAFRMDHRIIEGLVLLVDVDMVDKLRGIQILAERLCLCDIEKLGSLIRLLNDVYTFLPHKQLQLLRQDNSASGNGNDGGAGSGDSKPSHRDSESALRQRFSQQSWAELFVVLDRYLSESFSVHFFPILCEVFFTPLEN